MADGVRRLLAKENKYDNEKIKEQSGKFSKDIFMERIKKVIEEKMKE
jgi:hypothetical protein